MSSGNPSPPAGWYPDPSGASADRYWDGAAWTEQHRPTMVGGFSPPVTQFNNNMGNTRPRNGMGTASLVLGIFSLLIFGFILGLLAIIFGSIGIGRANRGEATNKGAAIAGMVLGIIGFVAWIFITSALFAS